MGQQKKEMELGPSQNWGQGFRAGSGRTSAQAEKDMFTSFSWTPLWLRLYSWWSLRMGGQQRTAPQELWERISSWKNEQATSWRWTVPLLLGHPFCVTLLLPWTSRTCSSLASYYGTKRKNTLGSLLLSDKGKQGRAADTFVRLRRAYVWHEWRTQHHLKFTLAPSQNRLWGPRAKTFPAHLSHFPLQSNCSPSAAVGGRGAGALLWIHWEPRVGGTVGGRLAFPLRNKKNELRCHYLHFR